MDASTHENTGIFAYMLGKAKAWMFARLQGCVFSL